jgi:hypothetical protein
MPRFRAGKTPEKARADENKAAAKSRAKRVAAGRCGFCGEKRNLYKWLCDGCAAAHREKQRLIACPNCKGTGWIPDADEPWPILCHICGGEQKITRKEAKVAAVENGWAK